MQTSLGQRLMQTCGFCMLSIVFIICCPMLFQLAREAVQIDSKIPHMVVGNQIFTHVSTVSWLLIIISCILVLDKPISECIWCIPWLPYFKNMYIDNMRLFSVFSIVSSIPAINAERNFVWDHLITLFCLRNIYEWECNLSWQSEYYYRAVSG